MSKYRLCVYDSVDLMEYSDAFDMTEDELARDAGVFPTIKAAEQFLLANVIPDSLHLRAKPGQFQADRAFLVRIKDEEIVREYRCEWGVLMPIEERGWYRVGQKKLLYPDPLWVRELPFQESEMFKEPTPFDVFPDDKETLEP